MKNGTLYPHPTEIVKVFSEEISNLNGTIALKCNSPGSLFLRATLPNSGEVAKGDRIRHGVAVRTDQANLVVHPYTFREICTNGAIHIENIASRVIELGNSPVDSSTVGFYFREAIQSCATPEAFQSNLNDMRETMEHKVLLALAISSLTSLGLPSGLMERIMLEFIGSSDQTGFGLMNAVTATAREEKKPEQKWKLEAIGGGILAWLKKPEKEIGSDYARKLPREEAYCRSRQYAESA